MDEIEEQIKVGGDMDDVLLCVPTDRAVALMAKFKANLVPLHLEDVPEKGQLFIQDPGLAAFHDDAGTFLTRPATPIRDTASKWLEFRWGPETTSWRSSPRKSQLRRAHRFTSPTCSALPSGSVSDHQAVPRSPVRVLGQTRVPEHLRRVREDY
jgi:hypothetical protein